VEVIVAKGKVREYDLERGYGVIIDSDTGQQLTVYANYLHLKKGETLKKDSGVEYEIENERNGPWAVNVRIV
jgi:cold shock CspA family protein